MKTYKGGGLNKGVKMWRMTERGNKMDEMKGAGE